MSLGVEVQSYERNGLRFYMININNNSVNRMKSPMVLRDAKCRLIHTFTPFFSQTSSAPQK